MKILQQYLLTAALVVVSSGIRAGETEQRFDIAAQDLGQALQKLAAQSGVSIFYASDSVAGRKAQALKGQYSTNAALTRLLSGSGLTYNLSADGSISVKPAPVQLNKAEPSTLKAVNVTANAIHDVKDPYNEDYVLPSATAGTKTDTPIMETPLNVQVVSKQVMKDQQVITLGDALKNVSGVTVTNLGAIGGGGGGSYADNNAGTTSNITLRGFASETYFRNGFRIQTGSGDRQMANVESVEVLKGPAAILYGLVEPGGMVNVVTKQPQATPYYAMSQQFGSYNTYRTTVDATGPIASNKDVLYRMNMSYQNSGSYQDFVGTDDLFLAPVVKWVISPKTQATFEFEYDRKNQGVGSTFTPYVNGQLYNRPMNVNYAGNSPALTETFFGGVNWSHQFNDDWSIKHRFSANQTNFSSNNIAVPAIALDGAMYGSTFGLPNDTYQIVGFNYKPNNQNNTYANNLDLTGHFDTFGLKHTLLVGGDYYRINQSNSVSSPPLSAYSIDPFNPVQPGTPFAIVGSANFQNKTYTDQYGVYGQDQIKLPFNVHVTGGLRYQNIHQQTGGHTWYTGDGFPTYSNSSAQSQDAVTPRVGILWHPLSWVSLYTNYAESFGANTGLTWSPTGQFANVAPTSASQYEGGVKTEFFGGRLRATLAYFDLTKTNVAVGDPNQAHDCQGYPGSCSLSVGAIRSRGPELDIQGEILPGWNAIATWSNTDIIVTKGSPGDGSLGINNSASGGGYAVGSRLLGVPRNTGSFWSTYELQQSELKGLKFGAGVTVRDGVLGMAAANASGGNDPAVTTPTYATLGLMTAYSRAIGKTKVTLQFNIDNVLDKRYYTSVNGITNVPGYTQGYTAYGAPRTAMGSISIQY